MKLQNIAVTTVLFDYPQHYKPLFYNNALNYFNESDIHIIRHNKLIDDDSYYIKLYYYKVVKVIDYIKENLLGKYEYILFLDATDTNFYSSPENIVENFKKEGCSIVMGAEKEQWPPTNFNHLYDKKNINSEYKYLNSGTYFGYTKKILEHLENIVDKKYQGGIDDQGQWTIEYLHSDDIIIDRDCKFFMSSLNSKKYINIIDGKVKIDGFYPIIVHDNGPFNDETIKISDKV